MGYRAHVQVKHEIEYGENFFNWCNDSVYGWLTGSANVDVITNDEWGCGSEWEINRSSLSEIPDSAYSPEEVESIARQMNCDTEDVVKELHAFVDALLAAPTGDWVYVSWF